LIQDLIHYLVAWVALMLSTAIFVHILVLNLSRVIMFPNCAFMVVMTFLAMPMIVGDSEVMKQSINGNEHQ
jgi:hypothetical protein